MRIKLCLPLFLPLLASAALLPETIGVYKRGTVSKPEFSDRAIWDEYGLKESETSVFEDGKKKLTATVWRLQDPTGALGAFDWQRPAKSTASTAAKLAAETPTGLFLAHGNYLISLDGYKPTAEELGSFLNSLNHVDTTSLPVLPRYLPVDGRVPNSERYVLGPAALEKFSPLIPPSVAAFQYGAEGQIGTFRGPKGEATMAIFNYPTHQLAMQRISEFEKIPGAVAQRSGPLVSVVLASADPDHAQRLLGQVRYQAEITRDEYVPTLRDNPGHLLLNVFVLIGILLAFAVVSGVAVGGIRAFQRRGGQGKEADAMITLRLGQ
jgi:hypothetical protein